MANSTQPVQFLEENLQIQLSVIAGAHAAGVGRLLLLGPSCIYPKRRQYGASCISAMPTSLYGPGDNFDLETSHVLPALIRRFHEAVADGREEIVLRGSGTPRREFLHVDDLAAACAVLLRSYDGDEPVNVGCGNDLTISEPAATVAEVTGFGGRIAWDTTRPDGTPRKLLDISRIPQPGWKPAIPLRDGTAATYAHWRSGLDG